MKDSILFNKSVSLSRQPDILNFSNIGTVKSELGTSKSLNKESSLTNETVVGGLHKSETLPANKNHPEFRLALSNDSRLSNKSAMDLKKSKFAK